MKRFVKTALLLALAVMLILFITSCRPEENLPPATESVSRIISIGPANTEIISALGFAAEIIAADTFSEGIRWLNPDIYLFDMMAPDVERMIALEPDIVFVTAMSSEAPGGGVYSALENVGINVVYTLPVDSGINEIITNIEIISLVLRAESRAADIINEMRVAMIEIEEKSERITDRRTVYFEIFPGTPLFSFGSGVFLNEMLELIGADNILADQNGWLHVSDEVIIAANPDVILVNYYFGEDPVAGILSRPGWADITAVRNGDVHRIDTDTSSRPSHRIVEALREMAATIYPEVFG